MWQVNNTRCLAPAMGVQTRSFHYSLPALEIVTVNLPQLAESITEGEIAILEVGE